MEPQVDAKGLQFRRRQQSLGPTATALSVNYKHTKTLRIRFQAAVIALTQRLDAQSQIQAVTERLSSIEEKVRNIPEYGPRIEMSRGVPSKPDELTEIGIKLEAVEDVQRLQEFGLPTSTFLQEKFPGKKVTRINACFAKILKKRRIALYEEDKEAHKIFILYHQGAWRIASFEDDRALMEEVLEEPVIQDSIEKLFGDLEPRRNEDGNADCGKRRATLSPFMRRSANA